MTRAAFVAAALLLTACSGVQREDEEVVPLEQVPPAVRKTIDANLAGGKVNEVERSTHDGLVIYEVEVRHAKGTTDLVIAEDGSLRKREAADEDDAEDQDERGDD